MKTVNDFRQDIADLFLRSSSDPEFESKRLDLLENYIEHILEELHEQPPSNTV